MKFGIKCKVDSATDIGKEPIQVTVDGREFHLVPSEEGLLSELTVLARIGENEFISSIAPSNEPEKAKWAIMIHVNQQMYDDLIDMIQYIEATLSFLQGVKKIYWEEAERVFVPESEEERGRTDVTNYALHREYPPDQNIKLTAADFKVVIQQKSKYEHLKIVKLFHREGMREFRSFRYIQAYYNFYFVLEDLYGEGKTQNKDIEKKFKSNQVLRNIIQGMIDNLIKGDRLKSIQNFLTEEKMGLDTDGIIELIVRVRGNLHHFSRKSTKRIGTPLNQADFESMAYLLMAISIKSLIHVSYEK